MDQIFVGIAIALSVIIVMPLYRVLVGPTLFDRLLGAGVIATKTLVLIVLIGLVFDRLDMFVDIAVAYAVLNFIGNIAMAKYFVAPRRAGSHLPLEPTEEPT